MIATGAWWLREDRYEWLDDFLDFTAGGDRHSGFGQHARHQALFENPQNVISTAGLFLGDGNG
jgi:hypothetical protein